MQRKQRLILIILAALSAVSCGGRRPSKPDVDVTMCRLGTSLGDTDGGFYIEGELSHFESVGIESVFLFDITGDGVPEAWLQTEGCEAERLLLVYYLSPWGKELYRDTAGHSMFYAGDGYVLRQWAHMGHSSWYRLRWDGENMVSEKVFEEETGGDYTEPIEKPVDEICPEDLYPHDLLKWAEYER